MKRNQRHHMFFLSRMSLASLMLLLLILGAWAEQADAFQRQVTRSGNNGNTATKTSNVSRPDQGYQRDVVRQGPQGYSNSTSAQGQWDADSGTWNRQRTATNDNGQSATATKSVTRTDDGYSSSKTVTGPQGNSATKNVQGSWDPETKTWSKSVSNGGD
nr:hypothetical protein [uncultured Desulfuromonas sp.]